MEAERDRLERELSSSKALSELEKDYSASKTAFMKKKYGIDICFLVDCTGSMGTWIT